MHACRQSNQLHRFWLPDQSAIESRLHPSAAAAAEQQKQAAMSKAHHVLVLPFPAQGHVVPLLALSHCLVEHGFKVTYVNTEFNHRRILSAMPADEDEDAEFEGIDMVSIADGLAPGEDRKDLGKLVDGFLKVMPEQLEEVIRERNERGDEVTWMVADGYMGWALRVAKKMGTRRAVLWPSASVNLAHHLSIPDLIQDGILHANGLPRADERTFQLFPGAPPLDTAHFSWNNAGDPKGQSTIFQFIFENRRALDLAEFVICNSFHELEPATFDLFPNMLPVGPLLASQRPKKAVGHFWSEDAACMGWLDGQDEGSVVYVAFGSFTVFGRRQFQELALGLELCGRPFLWVVRPDLAQDAGDAWFEGFCSKVAGRGMVVEWCPQQRVLAHPSVACFVSHCGWNSTMEGVMNGVPFLCWPYFTDQFINRSYICNVWKVGLSLEAGEGSGIVTRDEVKEKVEELLADGGIRAKAGTLKEAARRSIAGGGSSYRNFENIVQTMKE